MNGNTPDRKHPLLSVMIPTKNGGPLFEEVLQGLRAQDYPGEVELLVVDSGSDDQTLALARRYGARVETIPPAQFNHGLTRDHGIGLCRGEIIVLMTQDAVPADSGLLSALAAPFDDPEVGGAYARQLPRPEANVLTQRNLNGWFTGRTEPEVRRIENPATYRALNPWKRFALCNFDNVCSAVRRSAWEPIRFGRNNFGEDIAWCKSALEQGWKIAYTPDACVVHSHDQRSAHYQYKRGYMHHQLVYRLFGLRAIPTRQRAWQAFRTVLRQDMAYVAEHEPSLKKRLYLWFHIPGWTLASILAQYRGGADAARGVEKRQSGV
jgi:rhamnosyltransferase